MQQYYRPNYCPNYYPNCFRNADINPYSAPAPYMSTAPINNSPVVESQMFNVPDSWSFGPLRIEWSFDGESINMALKMFENAVRDILLTLSKPSVTITTTLGAATINLTINADFIKRQISVSGVTCYETICNAFNNTIIATW
jgi:hypothetical protein